MKPTRLVLALIMVAVWQTAAFAGDWYIHRTSEQMKVPPYYCYCYSMSKANVLAGKPTHPVDMQITEAQAVSKMGAYAALPETCPNNCGAGTGAAGTGAGAPGTGAGGSPLPPSGPDHGPAPECKKLAEVGGCAGFCSGMAAGHEGLGAAVAKCTSDCLEKYHCAK